VGTVEELVYMFTWRNNAHIRNPLHLCAYFELEYELETYFARKGRVQERMVFDNGLFRLAEHHTHDYGSTLDTNFCAFPISRY